MKRLTLSLLLLFAVAAHAGFGGAPSGDIVIDDANSIVPGTWTIWGSKNASNVSGALKFGQAVVFDTTQAAPKGWLMPGDMKLVGIWMTNTDAAADTRIQVFATDPGDSVTTLTTLDWSGLDASSSALSVNVDSGDVITIYSAIGAGSDTPSYPNVWLKFVTR